MQRIRQGIYLLESAEHSNSYLIEGPHGLTLFDAGGPRASPYVAEEIEGNGFALKDIEQIVISHAHFDHAGGVRGLLERHRVKVFAHPADIPGITGKDRRPPRSLFLRAWRSFLGLLYPYRPLQVVMPIDQGETLRALPRWQVLRLPGHTPGSIGLFHPVGKLLLCGDALNNRDGRLSLPSASHCDDPVQARDSAHRLAMLDLEVLGCGHGPVLRAGAGLKVQELLSSLG
jgi:glyoxylase-like metal-dependent hydrolase (beta-lactamase superfamily II)